MGLQTNELEEEGTSGEVERVNSTHQRLGAVVAGSFRIVRHIGSGGSSHVFEAKHVRLDKRFAVKVLRPELDPNRRTAQRFRREARAIARLQSEHVVSVVDCGELDDGTPYLVMELLEGEDLRSLLNREGAIPLRRAVALIIEACRGLTVVHQAGLIHRDLKPENLFITRRSTGEDWCKVLDFGVAKMESSLSTAENAIVGTARYMAPEQLADSAAVGPATDVYALGAILYECVAGHAVIAGTTVQEVMYRIMNAVPVPLSEHAPSVPSAIADLIERCLRKSPASRPGSAQELAELLLEATARMSVRPTEATLGEDDAPLPVVSRRHTTVPRLAAAAAVTAACGLLVGWFARGASPRMQHEQSSSAVRNPGPPGGESVPAAGMAPAQAPAKAALSAPSAAAPMPLASSRRPSLPSPRAASSAVSPKRALNGFDSANPYE